ncbi:MULTISPECIES: hypothetical protein [Acinetobacter]|jgi:hypothetical protein|uniref:Uncharacterized protein n=1 Tax=Acinetobacter chengduensis TaxID=2420890 RepID=A0ABX9TSV2_9GAMM|nr:MULTISPECIES: hypothetical protein [Acinetobacter]MBI1453394.1 hypothetical protein [Acinetobacter sp. FL51]RKG38977.1 hypothetical protein D7V31_14560 [Acinetobacter sp. WCHAc060007]RLL18360.1 hypothetical protein D9K81_15750 [Acinetobacter chengduensis]
MKLKTQQKDGAILKEAYQKTKKPHRFIEKVANRCKNRVIQQISRKYVKSSRFIDRSCLYCKKTSSKNKQNTAKE